MTRFFVTAPSEPYGWGDNGWNDYYDYNDYDDYYDYGVAGDGGIIAGSGLVRHIADGTETDFDDIQPNLGIIVTAEYDQVAAAHWAEERATWELYSHYGLVGIVGGYLTGNAAAVGGFGLFVADTVFDDAVQARADQLYYLDGLDGVWDGQSFADVDFIPFW